MKDLKKQGEYGLKTEKPPCFSTKIEGINDFTSSQCSQIVGDGFPARNLPGGLQKNISAHKNEQLNISELADLSDISRTTVYKYKSLLEA